MSNKHCLVIIVIVVICYCMSCASSTAPRGWLPSATEAQYTGFGSWIDVKYVRDSIKINSRGEFIAVGDDSLFCLVENNLLSIPLQSISSATITTFNSHHGRIASCTLLGMLSTGSHGFGAVVSAPLWIIMGSISTSIRSHEPIKKYGRRDWVELRKYARFPAGIPKNLDRSQL